MQYSIIILVYGLLIGCAVQPHKKTTKTTEAVSNYLNLAQGYLQEGYMEKAIQPLKRALEINPYYAETYGLLGLTYHQQGEMVLAETTFKKAIKYNPKDASIRNNYGSFLFSQNRLDEAYQQFYLAATTVDYEYRSRAYESMGIIAFEQLLPLQAQKHLTKALLLNAHLRTARLMLTKIFINKKDYSTAHKHYQYFINNFSHTSQSLLIGMEIAKAQKDFNALATYELYLARSFPKSKELQQHQYNKKLNNQ